MPKLSEATLRQLIKTMVELKIAIPQPVETAERLCGMANGLGK